MTRLLIFCLASFIVNLVSAQERYIYPETKRVNQTDTFFGDVIEDPYRWLEQQESEETKKWVNDQNKLARKYLEKIPNNFSLREQIRRNTEVKFLTPEKKGEYYFETRTKFGGKDLVIYYKKDFHKDPWEELFITKDIDARGEESINISGYEVSSNSKYIAYTFDKNGSDWKELKVADLENHKSLADHLYDIKLSSIVWKGNGFYYTKYERLNNEEQYKQMSLDGKLYYHKLGTTQDNDSLIFKKNGVSNNWFLPIVTKDERYLIINDHDPVNNSNGYYYFDFENKEQKGLLPLFKKSDRFFDFIGSEKDTLFFSVKLGDEKKVIAVNPQNPLKWIEKVRNIDNLITRGTKYHNGRFYKLAYFNQQETIVVFDRKGSIIKKIEIPFGSSCEFNGVDEKTNQLLLSYGSYLHPPIYAGMNLSTLKFELLEKVKISYDMDKYVIEKVFYKSDTAYVPMVLMHRKDIKMDSENPVLLEFYGGFGKINDPGYDAGKITFIENGGIYAFAMIRGGGEKGRYWHEDALLIKKQNSINDIVNATEYLINNKFSQPSKVAISGASHGGLMAAAAAMQRPDLFAAVIPVVGVYDMLRFEQFTIGTFHKDEFGTTKDSAMFFNLKTYSPLHNVKKGVKYPAMLFMTSYYDDRVPPLHTYKMVATMQELASKENPVLLRVEKSAGHNGARTYEKYIDQETDFYSFLLNALGVKKYK